MKMVKDRSIRVDQSTEIHDSRYTTRDVLNIKRPGLLEGVEV